MQPSHQSKYRPGANKNMQLDFAKLNEDNKSQFLQFLLKNNITFEKCGGKNDNGNYIAKVTITKNSEQNNKSKTKSKHQKSMFDQPGHKTKNLKINTSSLSMNKNLNKSTTMKTPRKQNSIQPKNIKNHLHKNKERIQKQKDKLLKNQYNNSVKSVTIKNKQNQSHFAPKSVRTTQFYAQQNILCNSKSNTSNLKQNKKILAKDHNKKPEKLQKQRVNLINKQNNMRIKQRENTNTSLSFSKQKIQIVEKQKINEINDKIRKKTQLQKQITELVNRFLKLFDLKLQGHRPMRWSLAQLVKTIQQIYEWVFQKNTQNLTQKGCNKQYQSAYSNHFIKFVKQFFISKHKNEKLGSSNLINMLYSLSIYLQNQKKLLYESFPSFKTQARQIKASLLMTATGVFMQTFQDFLCHIYQFQDLLFFLFIRSICCNLQGTSNIKIKSQKQSNKAIINQNDLVFGLKQVNKILKSILGNDEELLQQYIEIILNHLKSQNQQKLSKQPTETIKITCSQFMALMIQDYKRKRLIMQQQANDFTNSKNMSIENYSVAEQNTFESLIKKGFPKYKEKQKIKQSKSANFRNQNDTNQLTFGEETQQNFQQLLSMHSNLDFDKQFWQANIEGRLFKNYEEDSVQQLICQKMKRKVQQLIGILIQNRSEYNSIEAKGDRKTKYELNRKNMLWYELLLRKSLSLLNSIINMNKLQWFDELKVTDPTQDDIDKVEQLQLIYRKIKENPEAEEIGKICKSILTTPQVTIALEKLMNAENQQYIHF